MRRSARETKPDRQDALRKKALRMPIDKLVELSGVSHRSVTYFRSGKGVSKDTEKALARVLNVRRREAVYVSGRDFCGDPCELLGEMFDSGGKPIGPPDPASLRWVYDGLGVLEEGKLKATAKAEPKRVSIAGAPLWSDDNWGQ